MFSQKVVQYGLVIVLGSIAGSCGLLGIGGKGGGGEANGDLVGQSAIERRPDWGVIIPFGMVPVPAGTFHMGQADEDPASTQIIFNKHITIGGFFMD